MLLIKNVSKQRRAYKNGGWRQRTNRKQVTEKRRERKETNWNDKETELQITFYEDRACLWDLAYKDYMNRDRKEVAYCQINAHMSEKYTTIRDDYFKITIYANESTRICRFFPRLLGKSVCYNTNAWPFATSETIFPSLATWVAKHFVCFPLI